MNVAFTTNRPSGGSLLGQMKPKGSTPISRVFSISGARHDRRGFTWHMAQLSSLPCSAHMTH